MTQSTSPDSDETYLEYARKQVSTALADSESADLDAMEAIASRVTSMRPNNAHHQELILSVVQVMYVAGQAIRAIPLAQKVRLLGLETPQSTTTLDALIALGICSADTGNLPDAMEAYVEALALAREHADTVRQCKVWLNLGAALYYCGLSREALACFQRADSFASGDAQLDYLRMIVFSNIALCHLQLDEIRNGLVAIERAVALKLRSEESYDLLSRAFAEIHYTRLLVESKDFDRAREHAKLARQFANLSKSPRADIFADVAYGLVEVFSGRSDAGITRLETTLARARALRITTRDSLLALVKAYEFVGDPDRALVHLRELLDRQSATQRQNVLRPIKPYLEQLTSALEDEEDNAIRQLTAHEELLEGRVAKRALLKTQRESLERMAVGAELLDDASGVHPYRVGRLSSLLAREFGCSEEVAAAIEIAGRLHDIGKVGIPDGIIRKSGTLNGAEREILKAHTELGADLLQKSQLPNMQMAKDIALHHHDWWNGSGTSLAAQDGIPVAARIVALADVYDSLTHARPYKRAWRHAEAMCVIKERRGSQFDPQLTDRFITLMERLINERGDIDSYLGDAAKDSTFLQARRVIADLLIS